jgi:hypothetical protein
MLLKLGKYKLKTYSIDLICIQQVNDTKCSSFNIIDNLNYLEENRIEGVKNRVELAMLDLSNTTIDSVLKPFETRNYRIKHYSNMEYEVSDKFQKNNVRWIKRIKLFKKLYLLEINRLDSTSIEELVADIKLLNNEFTNIMKDVK